MPREGRVPLGPGRRIGGVLIGAMLLLNLALFMGTRYSGQVEVVPTDAVDTIRAVRVATEAPDERSHDRASDDRDNSSGTGMTLLGKTPAESVGAEPTPGTDDTGDAPDTSEVTAAPVQPAATRSITPTAPPSDAPSSVASSAPAAPSAATSPPTPGSQVPPSTAPETVVSSPSTTPGPTAEPTAAEADQEDRNNGNNGNNRNQRDEDDEDDEDEDAARGPGWRRDRPDWSPPGRNRGS